MTILYIQINRPNQPYILFKIPHTILLHLINVNSIIKLCVQDIVTYKTLMYYIKGCSHGTGFCFALLFHFHVNMRWMGIFDHCAFHQLLKNPPLVLHFSWP